MTQPPELFIEAIETPIGEFIFASDAEGRLHGAGWTSKDIRMDRQLRGYRTDGALLDHATAAQRETADRIRAYFAGDITAIDAIDAVPAGTPFQLSVWRALRDIPCGKATTYGALALSLGNPAAVRAVGRANGANPIGVVVPCHRVIGADGSLTGFGGGIERKRWLLAHEGHDLYAAELPFDW